MPGLSAPLHATLIASFLNAAGWRGVLLLGPSGAGKSDLALRALGQGWRLVADDRVVVWASDGRAFGRAPATLRGLIELRGQAVFSTQTVPFCEIVLAARLAPPDERQPEPAFHTVAGIRHAAVSIAPFEDSGPQRLRRIVERNTARL